MMLELIDASHCLSPRLCAIVVIIVLVAGSILIRPNVLTHSRAFCVRLARCSKLARAALRKTNGVETRKWHENIQ
jgi:hypothetical protein